MVHLVVVYGFQGASTDSEKLRLTEKLLNAVLCELAVLASGQPCLIVGDLNIEPNRIPCLLKGLMAGHWFDLQSSWAAASGVDPLPTCCKTFGSCGWFRRDFVLGCPLAVSALRWCSVLQDRWILPHYAVRSARVCLPTRFSVLWPAAWVACSDKSRSSKSVEVRRIWEVYDESLLSVHPAFWEGVRSSLLAGDVSSAWSIWSFSAEVSSVRAFVGSGVPVPESGFRLGRGAAQFRYVPIGGPAVGKVRSDLGSGDGQAVHLFKDASVSRVIVLRRRLGCVPSVLDGVSENGLALSRDLELSVQWDAIVSAGPCGLLCSANMLFPLFWVFRLLAIMFVFCMMLLLISCTRLLFTVKTLLCVVGVLGVLEDDKVHLYRWLKPDLVAPALFLCCDPCLTVDGSGFISGPDRIDEQFRIAWLPFFCRAGRGAVDLSAFDREVGGWLPRLGEVAVDLPPLLGSDLCFVVQHKQASASGLDGWEWRDLKAFPESWFDWLAVVLLSRVELDGVWPGGLLDADVTMIPKTDGDATLPFGQRPLCVLPVVYRIWASVRLRHLDGWLRSWLPLSVFLALEVVVGL